MRPRFGLLRFFGIYSLGFFSSQARSAQVARVELQDTIVLAGPGPEYKELAKLRRGLDIAVSNVPIGAYYKVRTDMGVIGFVSATSLRLLAQENPEESSATPVENMEKPQSTEVSDPARAPASPASADLEPAGMQPMFRSGGR